jgi:hypothetical protein
VLAITGIPINAEVCRKKYRHYVEGVGTMEDQKKDSAGLKQIRNVLFVARKMP